MYAIRSYYGAQRKREKIALEQQDVQGADALLEAGEILKANLSEIRRGMEEVTLADLYHPGQTRSISLDSRLNALQNAKQYFKRHRKLLDGAAHIEEQLAVTRNNFV